MKGKNVSTCLWTHHLPIEVTDDFVGSVITIVIINIITSVVAIIGNTTVLILFCKYQTLRKPSNMMIASLSVSDLIVGVTVQPYLCVRRIRNLSGRHSCVLRLIYLYFR